jgi:hypothetical protein
VTARVSISLSSCFSRSFFFPLLYLDKKKGPRCLETYVNYMYMFRDLPSITVTGSSIKTKTTRARPIWLTCMLYNFSVTSMTFWSQGRGQLVVHTMSNSD